MNNDETTGDVAGFAQTALFVAGLIAIAVGFGLWALPAGLIVGGAEAAGIVIVQQRGVELQRRWEKRL